MKKNKIDYNSDFATIITDKGNFKLTREELYDTLYSMRELEALENIVARAEKIMEGTKIKLDL